MIYRVKMDGNDILNFQEKPFVLTNPALEMEVNTAGSFSFTMPPCHLFYSDVHPFTSTIEVFEDEDLLWYGRPVDIKTDFWKNKQIYCEGALAFFNDTVQRPHEYDSIYVHDFFRTIISAHNEQVAPERQFTVGQVTVENIKVYRNLKYESTFSVIKRQCLNARGGYIFFRRENGTNYIDWLKEMPFTCNQPIEFGLNLIDITSMFSGDSFVTCVLPLGETDSETGKELTVAAINNGSDVIESEAAATYGRITKVVSFNGVRYADTLYEDGLEYLYKHQFNDLEISCDAAELHSQNPNYDKFRIGQTVRCHSVPHLLDREFPLIKMSVQLDTAAKKITLGSKNEETLTEITKFDSESAMADMENKLNSSIYDTKDWTKAQIEAATGGFPNDFDWNKFVQDWSNMQQGMPEGFDWSKFMQDWSNMQQGMPEGFDWDALGRMQQGLPEGFDWDALGRMPQGYDWSSSGGGTGGSKWTFQINGATQETGTANFVTS